MIGVENKKMYKIKLKKNKTVRKENYDNRDEYVFDKKTNVVPKKTNKMICIVFSEDKGAFFLYRKFNPNKTKNNIDYFRFKKGMYIIDNDSIHITQNNIRISFYLEGISTPIKMSNIEKEILEVKYLDLKGEERTSIVQKIKGLKFDAKILDIFLNRRFAEIFTRTPMKSLEFLLLIIGIVSLVMIGISYAISYYFR